MPETGSSDDKELIPIFIAILFMLNIIIIIIIII